jgi:hypothetical protein
VCQEPQAHRLQSVIKSVGGVESPNKAMHPRRRSAAILNHRFFCGDWVIAGRSSRSVLPNFLHLKVLYQDSYHIQNLRFVRTHLGGRDLQFDLADWTILRVDRYDRAFIFSAVSRKSLLLEASSTSIIATHTSLPSCRAIWNCSDN